MMSYYLEKEHRNVSSSGVTLIELLVVIGLMAILMAIAIPRLNLIQSSKLNGAARVVWSDMHHAKMTAIKENESIRVVFSTDGYKFERVSDSQEVFSRDISLEYKGISIVPTNPSSIIFRSDGRLPNNQFGKTIKLSTGTDGMDVVINMMGRVRLDNGQ
ncbi:MAG: prepilin-type N-terminal cleavage/methylation domain-containing protein [Desulfonatronovibrio sp. MSAO_Bac4]|nr:MAG: prepilin-type N-terminal cleavage/methylation domain-containing protein [Desulfonatronovibrio sp. MSAO_Bac4]